MSTSFAALAIVAAGAVVAAQQVPATAALRVLPVRGNIYMVSGAGSNVTVSVGKDGVLLVDTGAAATADSLIATIRELNRQVTARGVPASSCVGVVHGCTWWDSANFLQTTAAPPPPKPIAWIINTSAAAEHTGGNEKVSAEGRVFGIRNLPGAVSGAWIVAHENVTTRLTESGGGSLPAAALPSETYHGDDKKLNFFNGEGVVVKHMPAAHTDGDSIVYFRGSDVIAAGDLLDMTQYPRIDVARGGTIQGSIDALNALLDLMVVEHMMEGGTLVVPGHGRIADAADVAYYRDMVTIIRDRVRELRKRGKSLAEITAAQVTKDYDPRFGRSPAWTPAMFVAAIHASLPKD